jgi:hypothetical protein
MKVIENYEIFFKNIYEKTNVYKNKIENVDNVILCKYTNLCDDENILIELKCKIKHF